MDRDFLWRAEMACRAAWPSQTETAIGGWVARRSGGSVRRVNSLNQLPACAEIDERLIDETEAHFARFEQQALVRLASFVGHSGQTLLRRGYRQEGHTTTLLAELARDRDRRRDRVSVSPAPEPDWMAARSRIAASDPDLFRSMLDLIEGDRLFAGARQDDILQSVAYGVIVDGLLVIESVATSADHQGKGLARQAVGALIDWAVGRGIDRSVLQVVTGNAPARALYRSLGYTVRLYDYVYLRQART
jgi:GNAT superfamily N-acetyltransferase